METPGNKEVIDALNTVFLNGYDLTDKENEFILDCINNINTIEYLQSNIQNMTPVAISIYNKLEKLYNELEEQ